MGSVIAHNHLHLLLHLWLPLLTQQGGQTNWQSDPFQSDPNKIPAAQTLGYAAGTQSPLGMLSAVIPGMGMLQSLLVMIPHKVGSILMGTIKLMMPKVMFLVPRAVHMIQLPVLLHSLMALLEIGWAAG
jgi:hypothetical protein